jgi:hypothetical protein
MKYLKLMLLTLVMAFTFGSAMAQVVVRARVGGGGGYYYHHRHYHHRTWRHNHWQYR